MSRHFVIVLACLVACSAARSLADTSAEERCPHRGPEAAGRSYAVVYRDMELANCIAKAYAMDLDVDKDAGSSASALIEWLAYDMDSATKPMWDLLDRYLDRRYTAPAGDTAHKDVRFDFMKCLDLYHSAELKDQVRRYVMNPDRTAREDVKAMNLNP